MVLFDTDDVIDKLKEQGENLLDSEYADIGFSADLDGIISDIATLLTDTADISNIKTETDKIASMVSSIANIKTETDKITDMVSSLSGITTNLANLVGMLITRDGTFDTLITETVEKAAARISSRLKNIDNLIEMAGIYKYFSDNITLEAY